MQCKVLVANSLPLRENFACAVSASTTGHFMYTCFEHQDFLLEELSISAFRNCFKLCRALSSASWNTLEMQKQMIVCMEEMILSLQSDGQPADSILFDCCSLILLAEHISIQMIKICSNSLIYQCNVLFKKSFSHFLQNITYITVQ